MKIMRLALTAVLWIGLLAATQGAADTHYVATNGTHGAPFITWTTAATNIQAAVTSAVAGDVVLVSNGTYAASAPATAGTYTASIVVTQNITLSSVNGSAVTIIDGNYPLLTNRCLFIASNAVVVGFTITNGHAETALPNNMGGGVFIYYSGTLTNCIVSGNSTSNAPYGDYWCGGGGMFCYMGGPAQNCQVRNCLITGNVASNSGGGILCYRGTVMTGCVISNNGTLYNTGGGVRLANTNLMSNCVIVANWIGTSASHGGGVSLSEADVVDDCRIMENYTIGSLDGGGVRMDGGIVKNSWIINNVCKNRGAGVALAGAGIVSNCVVSSNNNTAGNGGGFVLIANDALVVNCIVASNRCAASGGGLYWRGGA